MLENLSSTSPKKANTSSALFFLEGNQHPIQPLRTTHQTDNMRLISFAALSFLAITVSAYPGPGTPHQSTTTQSALQHQSTDVPGAHQLQGDADLNDPDLQSAIAQSLQEQQNDDDLDYQQFQLALAESAQQLQESDDPDEQELRLVLAESTRQHQEGASRNDQQFRLVLAESERQQHNDVDPDDRELQSALAESEKQLQDDRARDLRDHLNQFLKDESDGQSLKDRLVDLDKDYKEKKTMADGMHGFINLMEAELMELGKLLEPFNENDPVQMELFDQYLRDSKALEEMRKSMEVLEVGNGRDLR
ncbi:hypothetical protein BASA81_013082 [Batrachochytrium salamandrivorans]|nr:hypothetical protein BASA81_013082 [Batrachochytrium salamandrivorans]